MSRIFYQIKILLFWLNKFTFWSQEDFFYYKIGVMHHLRRYFPFFFTFLQIVKFMWDILLSALVRLGCFSNCVSFFLVQKFFSFLFSQGYSTSWSCLSGTTLKTEESEVLTLTQVTAFKKTKSRGFVHNLLSFCWQILPCWKFLSEYQNLHISGTSLKLTSQKLNDSDNICHSLGFSSRKAIYE